VGGCRLGLAPEVIGFPDEGEWTSRLRQGIGRVNRPLVCAGGDFRGSWTRQSIWPHTSTRPLCGSSRASKARHQPNTNAGNGVGAPTSPAAIPAPRLNAVSIRCNTG
jgi:hypothetical protein